MITHYATAMVGRGNHILGDHRDNRPVPAIADYEAYCATLDNRAQKHFNPYKHRRITILTRGGDSLAEACRLVGMSVSGATKSRAKMPERLK